MDVVDSIIDFFSNGFVSIFFNIMYWFVSGNVGIINFIMEILSGISFFNYDLFSSLALIPAEYKNTVIFFMDRLGLMSSFTILVGFIILKLTLRAIPIIGRYV